ncbi:MAG: hypothetical protein GYA12_09100, partial [Chloroflexi bacterium]|nr:hypothetical protein [Chloroflexota bacterium]
NRQIEIINILLKNRGLTREKDREEFFNPKLPIELEFEDIGIFKSEVEKIAAPEPVQPAPSPRIVTSINDREYVDLNGTHGWSIFTFHFDGSNVARLELDYGEKSENINALIGLDGIYRITKTINYGPVAIKGYWKNENTFVLFQQFLREAERLTMTLTFSEIGINRHTEWLVENHSEDSEAVFLNR